MLVIARQPKQELMIGDDIKIKVLKVSESQVYIGIDAPFEIKIWRQEIYDKIHNQEAGSSSDKTVL